MKQIDLQEYQDSKQTPLTISERDLINDTLPSVSTEPVKGKRDTYVLRPGSTVGALEIGNMSVLIEPKIGIPQLLSMACYALDLYKPQSQELFDFQKAQAIPDVLALALFDAARRAFGRGLLRGYLSEEDALHTVRGRIRFDEQIRRRYGIPLPIELRFDEFTEDILANRLVKAAAARLRHMTLRSSEARRGIGWVAATLESVSLLEFRRRNLPEVRFDRLNEHYRDVVGLARLILLHSEFESFRGDVRTSGFLIDMNKLFQEFVTRALRKELGLSEATLKSEKNVPFDIDDCVTIEPDLSWWDGETCRFVGDAKYKDLTGESAKNADLYQLLAYATALDLPGGLLIYAQGAPGETTYQVKYAGKLLIVAALDLSVSIEGILRRVTTIADIVRNLRDKTLSAKATEIAGEQTSATKRISNGAENMEPIS